MTSSIEDFQFGTDGLRGRAGEPPLDPETLRRVGAALGLWLQRHGPDQKRVLIGNDGRDSAGWILEALAQGLSKMEAATADLGLTTTPALAHVTRHSGYDAGIMISASHNPAEDNGIKIFTGSGSKLPDDAQDEIAALAPTLDLGDLSTPRSKSVPELLTNYQEALANTFKDLDLTGKTVVIDAANGGGADLAPSTLRALGADVVTAHCEPDGWNINDGCGALHPEGLAEMVRASGAVLGICLDGDGDRGIFLDENGRVRDGDDVLLSLGVHLQRSGELPADTVVTTVMSNLAMHKALRAHNVQLAVTPVGDRHVTKRMREEGFSLGAETSGHVVFKTEDDHMIGDGLYTALSLLALPGVLENGASHGFVDFDRFPQILLNVPVDQKPDLATIPEVVACQKSIESDLGDDGRVVLRYSGTENLCRVMVEGPKLETVQAHVDTLAAVVQKALAQ